MPTALGLARMSDLPRGEPPVPCSNGDLSLVTFTQQENVLAWRARTGWEF